MMDGQGIFRKGVDLIVSTTVLDSSGNGKTSGIAVKCSVRRLSDGKFWNSGTNAFDLGSEPTLDTMPHQNNGLYELTLTNGSEIPERNYTIHIEITGDIAKDFAVTEKVHSNTDPETIAEDIWSSIMQFKDIDGTIQREKVWVMIQAIYASLKQRMENYSP